MNGKWSPIDRGRLALRPFESMAPQLWRGAIGIWPICLYHGGDRLREWTAGGQRAEGTVANFATSCWQPSPIGWALNFDGTNDQIQLPAFCSTTRLATTTGITIFAVINITGSVNTRQYITNGAGGATPAGFGFGISDAVNNQTKWYTGNGAAGHNLQGGTTMTAATWYSVAATYFPAGSGNNKFTYLDGKVDQSGASATTMTFSSTTAGIGYYANAGTQFFPGLMAFMGVWNYAMDARQIAMLNVDPLAMFRKRRKLWSGVTTAIEYDASSNSGYQASVSSYSWSHTCNGQNRFLSVDISLLSNPGTTVTGVTYNGVAMTLEGALSSAGNVRVECWRLVAPASGINTIAVTFSAAVSFAGTAVSYKNVHQTTPTESFSSATAVNAGAADATVTVTTVSDNDWTHGAVATDDDSITANQTSRGNVSGAGVGSGADEDIGPKTPAGSVTISYTNVGAAKTWAIAAYAIRPVAATVISTVLRDLPHDARFQSIMAM